MDTKQKEDSNNNSTYNKNDKLYDLSFTLLYQILLAIKLLFMKEFLINNSINNFISLNSLFGLILSLLHSFSNNNKKSPQISGNIMYLIIKISFIYLNLFSLSFITKNLNLKSVSLIILNTFFNSIIDKKYIFVLINLFGLSLIGVSYHNLYVYIYIFTYFFTSFISIYLQSILMKKNFDIHHQNLIEKTICFGLGFFISFNNKLFHYNNILPILFVFGITISSDLMIKILKEIKNKEYLKNFNYIGIILIFCSCTFMYKETINYLDFIALFILNSYQILKSITHLISTRKKVKKE